MTTSKILRNITSLSYHSQFDCEQFNVTEFHKNKFEDFTIYKPYQFWIGGVIALFTSVLGILMNIIGICVISTRLSKRNIFNHMIVILFIVSLQENGKRNAAIKYFKFGYTLNFALWK